MSKNYFVTGGAGFIGSNYVSRLLERREKVIIYDNLSRAGASRNLAWLQEKYGAKAFDLVVGDVRDAALLTTSSRLADVIIHLAAQVAVTTSVTHPREDFEINALGTFQYAGGCPSQPAQTNFPVCFHQQGIRRHGRCEGGGRRHALALCRPAARLPRDPAA